MVPLKPTNAPLVWVYWFAGWIIFKPVVQLGVEDAHPVQSAAWKSIVSEVTLGRAAGDYINDKESKFPVMM